MRACHDPGRLHVITDETLQQRFTHRELAAICASAGADVIQYRDKRELADSVRLDTARAMREVLEQGATRLIVNDEVEVARAVSADGVHLGPRDAQPAEARRLLGPRAWIGATVNTLESARAIETDSVDYVGVGPVFGTRSKQAPAPELGLSGLARIAEVLSRPVIAIGNITPDRVVEVIDAGAHGVAVLSGVVCNDDPGRAVACYRDALDRSARSDG